MQTIVRTLIILAASLLVVGATYAVGQTEWASQQSMGRGGPPGEHEHEHEEEDGSREGGERGERDERREGPPNFHAAAEILGIKEDELVSALGGFPPDVEAASETLGIPAAEIEAAMEEAGTREGHGHEARPFSIPSLFTFASTLLQIGFVIAVVTWGRKKIEAREEPTVKSSAH